MPIVRPRSMRNRARPSFAHSRPTWRRMRQVDLAEEHDRHADDVLGYRVAVDAARVGERDRAVAEFREQQAATPAAGL